MTPAEFKTGQTVAADWLGSIHRSRALAAQRGAGQPAIAPAQLVYGGGEPRTRSGVDITRWRRWPQRAQALLAQAAAACA